MTPKEKAQEIFDKYFDKMLSFGFYLHNTQINKLALIAVDEILEITEHESPSTYVYYKEVKKEIEAL